MDAVKFAKTAGHWLRYSKGTEARRLESRLMFATCERSEQGKVRNRDKGLVVQ